MYAAEFDYVRASSIEEAISLKGENDGGYEWVEWPKDSDKHWYRAENSKQQWQRYKS